MSLAGPNALSITIDNSKDLKPKIEPSTTTEKNAKQAHKSFLTNNRKKLSMISSSGFAFPGSNITSHGVSYLSGA